MSPVRRAGSPPVTSAGQPPSVRLERFSEATCAQLEEEGGHRGGSGQLGSPGRRRWKGSSSSMSSRDSCSSSRTAPSAHQVAIDEERVSAGVGGEGGDCSRRKGKAEEAG